MLRTSVEHYRRQQRISAAGLIAARRERRNLTKATEVLVAFQILAARDAVRGVDDMLAEQGIDEPAQATVVPESVAGVASDGRLLGTLLEQARDDFAFGLIVATQLQDAARGAASLGITARQNIGYARMLNPPSCSRCAILAGKFYRWNEGFQRHPRCDCRHIPAREADSSDLTTNPDAYFASLPEAEQDRIFTKSGAQAIRDGADMGQVVNARRGMQKAQVFGQDAFTTLEGTSRRGFAYSQLRGRRDQDRRALGERFSRTQEVRLMPESIYALAKDRADALRLLKLHGYVL